MKEELLRIYREKEAVEAYLHPLLEKFVYYFTKAPRIYAIEIIDCSEDGVTISYEEDWPRGGSVTEYASISWEYFDNPEIVLERIQAEKDEKFATVKQKEEEFKRQADLKLLNDLKEKYENATPSN